MCAALLTFTFAASGEEPPQAKPAWLMDHNERLARRYDSSAAAARLRLAVAEGDVQASTDIHKSVVVGRRNPELLMPGELMEHVYPRFSHDVAKQREVRDKWTERGGARYLGDDYWIRLQKRLQPLIETNRQRRDLQMKLETATGAEKEFLREAWSRANDALCPLRAKGLAAAREIFGRENFDRFLYEVVAPDVVIISSYQSISPSSPSGEASLAIWDEEGCQ
jgi:hypothetical protein